MSVTVSFLTFWKSRSRHSCVHSLTLVHTYFSYPLHLHYFYAVFSIHNCRFVKEAMLNLLLLRAADWQEEVFSKKNTFPEDQKEIPDTAQRCGAAGEGTEVSDEVNQKEALKVASVTTTSENLSKTDHTRPSAETASPTVSSITPKTQPDNLQATTAMSSLSLHSSNSNNSNSILNSADCQQNFKSEWKKKFFLVVYLICNFHAIHQNYVCWALYSFLLFKMLSKEFGAERVKRISSISYYTHHNQRLFTNSLQ